MQRFRTFFMSYRYYQSSNVQETLYRRRSCLHSCSALMSPFAILIIFGSTLNKRVVRIQMRLNMEPAVVNPPLKGLYGALN